MSLLLVLSAIAFLWLVCGVFAYKATFTTFQMRYPDVAEGHRTEDKRFAIFLGLFGPLGLAALWFSDSYKYGFTREKEE